MFYYDNEEVVTDMFDIPIELGDILLNRFFGDYWLVEESTDEYSDAGEDYGFIISRYGNKDDYYETFIPESFEIVKRKNDDDYEEFLQKIIKIGKDIEKEMNEEF